MHRTNVSYQYVGSPIDWCWGQLVIKIVLRMLRKIVRRQYNGAVALIFSSDLFIKIFSIHFCRSILMFSFSGVVFVKDLISVLLDTSSRELILLTGVDQAFIARYGFKLESNMMRIIQWRLSWNYIKFWINLLMCVVSYNSNNVYKTVSFISRYTYKGVIDPESPNVMNSVYELLEYILLCTRIGLI